MPPTRSVRPARALVRVGLTASLLFGAVACSGDDDGDTQTIQSEDGEITVTGDGDGSSGVITGPDGEETEFSAGEGAEIPEGWPEWFALPEGSEVLTGTSMDGGDTLSVIAGVEGDVSDAYDHFKGVLEGEGVELSIDTLSDLGDETMASLGGEKDGKTLSVILMADAVDEGRVSMSLGVTPSA